MKTAFRIWLSLVALFSVVLVSFTSIAEVTSLRGDTEISETKEAPTIKNFPRKGDKIALDYVNQPPVIPHSVDGYQFNKSNNTCLQCHDVDNYRSTGATRISPTHFSNRDGDVDAKLADRRYFCLQCHVPQVTDKPVVANNFEPIGKFGKE